MSTYHSTDAAPADGRLEFAVQLFDGAGGIKALSQEDDPVQEEKGSDAVDDVLHQLNPVKERRHQLQPSNLRSTRLRVPDPSPPETHMLGGESNATLWRIAACGGFTAT